jgi:hypothetical protein
MARPKTSTASIVTVDEGSFCFWPNAVVKVRIRKNFLLILDIVFILPSLKRRSSHSSIWRFGGSKAMSGKGGKETAPCGRGSKEDGAVLEEDGCGRHGSA